MHQWWTEEISWPNFQILRILQQLNQQTQCTKTFLFAIINFGSRLIGFTCRNSLKNGFYKRRWRSHNPSDDNTQWTCNYKNYYANVSSHLWNAFFWKSNSLIFYQKSSTLILLTNVKASAHLCKKTAITRSRAGAKAVWIPIAIPSKILKERIKTLLQKYLRYE